MVAVAQKKYLHIYDNQGIELHQIKDHLEPCKLEYLPYHYLLCSASKLGFLKYIDITSGKEVAECKTKRGEPLCLSKNQQNGVMVTGHSSGEALMWTPNMASTPVVKILAHVSSPLTSVSVSSCGKYMVTTGKDSRFKIWDIRNSFKCLHDYFTPSPPSSSDISQQGLISISFGNELHIWKNTLAEKQKAPYLKHKLSKHHHQLNRVKFVPYEDTMGMVHDVGYSSIIVPGAGISNFDSYEQNPFEQSKERRERMIHGLLEKLDPATISLKVKTIGQIDEASKEVREKEEKEEFENNLLATKRREKKAKKKMRGRTKIGNKVASSQRQMHEKEREKNKLAYLKDYQKSVKENQTIEQDLDFLGKFESKFDPLDNIN
mmetsp:Transcript_13165/g.22305  ORF Transcript_13165/g.22305 Transcript_13165/m.22305 type:complete len:376 (-) Transcript_13165:20-1147(-)